MRKDLAEIMGYPHQAIDKIIDSNQQITPETAAKLAKAFGTSAELWTNLESKYMLHAAKKESEGNILSHEKIQ